MDLVAVLRSYVERMLREVSGIKVLVLDPETTRIVSAVYSQTDILEQDVYLVERLDNDSSEPLKHMKAVCFLRPTRENIARIRRELRDPRYAQYHLFFTNRLDDIRMQDLAEMDVSEAVLSVQEFFGDFITLDGHHFSVPVGRPACLLQPVNWDVASCSEAVDRMTEGLAALALSLRRRFTIRYQRGSEVCQKLGESLEYLTGQEDRGLFDFGRRAGEPAPLMLLLDRRDDPVTPLLLQWTFQAMVAELLGMELNRVDLSDAPEVKQEFKEIVLSARQDDFFRKNMYANFGEVGIAVKELVGEYQKATNSSKKMQTIEDMQNFVDSFGEFSAAQRSAGKHVTLMSELSAAVDRRSLMDVSSVEQELVCGSGTAANMQQAFEDVSRLLANSSLTDDDRVRLVMLFALRYERDGREEINRLIKSCQDFGMDLRDFGVVRTLLLRAGADQRVGDLFSDKTVSSRLKGMAMKTVKGVENVYTQHTPLLTTTLESVARGRLPHIDFPRLGGGDTSPTAAKPPRLVVVFIVGGSTYEEARAVAEANAAGEKGHGWSAGMRIILGGTGVATSKTFVQQLREVERSAPARH
mmetsp:Transcript_18589/g.56139  ORF Transcript_18589/g.56139 Transcript_18589/m.56139 type:complete len:583 (+) Transcript_18589:324-2072(+)|eukprot:CAMPEP_0206142234 /NCGR_PEP_ID=MMETSP1473-20131121/16075_1 /ASSEMBLY_ACC=CAM_ASM_001109 /TAXON_ID=1461547 /ORGANISM="Stichococcus sp, Strain RCC1054" /LENGTH=582 /DNA_ID=CAMNT_0053537151 /DNA_START=255 /DNA_END=2003 /DNA_ORIENTATION=+